MAALRADLTVFVLDSKAGKEAGFQNDCAAVARVLAWAAILEAACSWFLAVRAI